VKDQKEKAVGATGGPRRVFLGCFIAIGVLSSVLALRDIARRSDHQVRGPKIIWRVLMSMNPGNSIFYWLFGRK
jgi:hypothetical protein